MLCPESWCCTPVDEPERFVGVLLGAGGAGALAPGAGLAGAAAGAGACTTGRLGAGTGCATVAGCTGDGPGCVAWVRWRAAGGGRFAEGAGGARRPEAESGTDERPMCWPASWLADQAMAAAHTRPISAASVQRKPWRVTALRS